MGHRAIHGMRFYGLDCKVFMVKVSYEQSPSAGRSRTHGATVTLPIHGNKCRASDSGRLSRNHRKSGLRYFEAVEAAVTNEGYRYVLGSVLNQVLLHQSIIGLETKAS